MSYLKKLSRRNMGQIMHNSEDARVRNPKGEQKKDRCKGELLKPRVAQAAKMVKRIPYYVWLFEKSLQGWDWLCEHAESIFEVIS